MQINGSIVLYQNDEKLLKKAISSFLNTQLEVKLYLIDNSPTDSLKYLSNFDERIEYIFNNANLGFGKAHNIALKKSINNNVAFHLVLNPDAYFEEGVIEELYEYMEANKDVANVVPKVYNLDGTIQKVCRLLPTPMELIVRRFIPFKNIRERINKKFELHHFNYKNILNIPFFVGCFMFLRVEHLKEIGLFDEKIFMYMEDIDLNRRLHAKYKTIFYPYTSIVHIHARESYKRKTLFIAHIKSTIYYFNKWGWLIDRFRKKKNKEVLKAIETLSTEDKCSL